MVKCNNIMTFLSQIGARSITAKISDDDLKFLISSGYVSCISKDEYEKLAEDVANLPEISSELEEARKKERVDEEILTRDEKKVHSIRFWFEGREKKEAEREQVQADEQLVSKDEETEHEKSDEMQLLIQKKSALDRQAQCGECYLSLTGTGAAMLHDLTIRNYRVGEKDFNEFIQEIKATEIELQSIAQRASYYYSIIKDAISNMDTSPLASEDNDNEDEEEDYRIKSKGVESSQLWAVSIGLAKLEGDPDKIADSFIKAINTLQKSNSNLDSKLMAAETFVASGRAADSLTDVDHQIRQSANVPEELSTGIAATISCGSNPGGLTRFDEFSKITKSYTAAAILSGSQEAEDELRKKFESFKSTFDAWGYSPSEDTDLAAAYLAISQLSEDKALEKMNAIVNAIKNEFEFPLVPAAILTSIQALDADELLDLAEKAASILQSQPLAAGLAHSELASLAIRMIYGQ
jgi:hypothetical protein